MDFYRYVLFLCVVCNPVCSLGNHIRINKSVTDSASHPVTIGEYNKLITRYRYLNPDSAIIYVQQGIKLAKHNKDYNGLATMLNQQGMVRENLGLYDSSEVSYQQALTLYKHTSSLQGIATENLRLGAVEQRKGNYKTALNYFLEALKVSEGNGDNTGKMDAYRLISEVYSNQGRLDDAYQYLNKAEQLYNVVPFSNFSLNVLNDLGQYYRDIHNYDKAKAYLEKGITLADKPQYLGLNITLSINLASVYAKQGLRTKAVGLLLKSLQKSREIKNYLRELQTLIKLGEDYGTANAEQALYYYNQALALVKKNSDHKQAIAILNNLADLYHYQGNDTQAYLTKKEQHEIADKYYYQEMAQQMVSLQAQYELSQSKASIQALKYVNNREVLERRIISYVADGFILLLGIMVILFYRASKLNGLLNIVNTKLRETNTVKDKLFSILAHDLRTPFATIITMLNVVKDDNLSTAERNELIGMVLINSNASLDILNNLLKWGEMQLKGVRLNPVDLNPKNIINRNIAMLSGIANVKSVRIKNQVDEEVSIITDPDHFEFILRNLLSNAIKFTPEGGVVTLSALTDVEKNEVEFVVADNGIGINPEKLERIFNISNISSDGTNEEKGSSLGLVLCKEFIEANKGRIWAESTVGKGSMFIFCLRRSIPKQ